MFFEINRAYPVSFIFFLTCVSYAHFCAVTLLNNTKSKSRGDYLSAGFCLVVYSLCYGLMTISLNEPARRFFWAAGFISGCLFFSRWLLFSTNMVAVRRSGTRFVINALSVLTVVYSLICVFSNNAVFVITKYGAQYLYQKSPLFVITTALMSVYAVLFFVVTFRWLREAEFKRDRMQALLFIILSATIAPLGLLSDYVIPTFTDYTTVPLASVCFLIASAPLFFSMNKHKTLSITVPNASGYVFNTVTVPTLVLDHKNVIKLENKAAQEFFGRGVVGVNIADIILSDGAKLDRSSYDRDILQKKVMVETQSGLNPCSILLSIENDKYGDALCKVVVLRDIREEEEKDDMLHAAIESATAASKVKSDFLSHMSHEIRTPLNAIIGMIHIGLGTDQIKKKNYCLERANNASKHLLGTINDILDMSKIEADKFELSFGEIEFETMLMSVTNVINVKAAEKHQDLIVNIKDDVPACFEGDELRLSQVVTNLLSNAIKFTPDGGTVVLEASKTEEIGNEVVLRIEVTDTGIGITKEQQERLFSSFSQAEASITKRFGGTGLGLAICKRIVELMGGNIWVESEFGNGAKFIFTVKVKKIADKPREKLLASISPRDYRILAVDDCPATREFFIHVMEAMRLTCDVAAGGAEALEMIRGASENPYNIFFVDWHMPEMDGIDLTKKIMDINGGDSIIILITVSDWNAIEEEAVAAGVKHFLSKPLFPSMIINAINICISAGLREFADIVQSAPPKHSDDFGVYTLLIAEDVDINREIMSAILEETGISIDFAENGKIAVDTFRERPEKYDLILMDINMPEMDGYEATRIIRAIDDERAKQIPIVAMTANVFKEDIEKCLEAGMNDHIGKPISFEEVLEKLRRHLSPVNR